MDVMPWQPSPELERAVRAEMQARFDILPERLFDSHGRIATPEDPGPSAPDQHPRLEMFSVFAGMVREAASAVVSVSSRVHGVNPQPEMVEWLRCELTGLIPAVVTGCIFALHRMGLLRRLSFFDGIGMRWSLKREAQRECELALKPLWLATMQSRTAGAPMNVFLSHATEDLEGVASRLPAHSKARVVAYG